MPGTVDASFQSLSRYVPTMDEQDFVQRYPRLWHLAHGDAWDGITRHGLLSAQRLVELFKVEDPDPLLGQRRAESTSLAHPAHGTAVLRDQEPVDTDKLAACLSDGMTVEGWLRMLNGFVFLFSDEGRLNRMRDKYAERHPVLVLRFQTDSLVRAHGEFMRVATINTGYTDRKPVVRGPDTFCRVRRFDLKNWARIQEVVIPGEIPDVRSHVDDAYRLLPDGSRELLW